MASESSLRREYASASATTHVPPTDRRDRDEEALYSPNEESEDKLGSVMDVGKGSGKEGEREVGKEKDESRSDSNNILDDMEKFQREIEELRLRYTQSK